VAIPVPESHADSVVWPEAAEQAPGELYDVFTPPKIYLDKDGQFSFTLPYVPSTKRQPFGIYLSELKRKPYRIQLEGYVEEDLKDASKSLLLLSDEEQQQRIRARVGEQKPEFGFSVVGFTIERIKDEFQNITKVAKATILDQRSGKEVVLTDGERLYEDEVTVVIRSEQDSSVDLELTKEGESFETPSGKYVLEEINLEESTVTVKKLGDEEHEPEVKQLAPRPTIESKPKPEDKSRTASPDADTSSPPLDFMF